MQNYSLFKCVAQLYVVFNLRRGEGTIWNALNFMKKCCQRSAVLLDAYSE